MSTMNVERLPGRSRVSTGRKWETVVGYSRATRIGDIIAVTGTVGVYPDGRYPETAEEQAKLALRTIVEALRALGSGPEDVIRTRMYVTDISRWEEIGRAHAAVFAEVRPATTMVQVAALIDPEAMVEVEADAVVNRKD